MNRAYKIKSNYFYLKTSAVMTYTNSNTTAARKISHFPGSSYCFASPGPPVMLYFCFLNLALIDRNIQVKFGLKRVLES